MAAGARVALSATTERDQAFGPAPGAVRWSRVAATVGPMRELRAGSSRLELHGGLAGAVVRVQGVGFTSVSSARGFEGGIAGGVRWVWGAGGSAPWVGVEALGWPWHQRTEVGGVPGTGQLPRLDLQLAAGLSLGRYP